MTPRHLPDGRIEIRPRVRIDDDLYQRLVQMGRLLSVTPDTVFARIVQRWREDKEAERLEHVFDKQPFGPVE